MLPLHVLKHVLKKGSCTTLLCFLLVLCSLAANADASRISHQDLDIQIGQAIFEKIWVFAPSSTRSSDGLGPLYNARSCSQCHEPTSQAADKPPVSLVMMLSIESEQGMGTGDTEKLSDTERDELVHRGFIPEPVYGQQIQTFAYPGAYAEAVITRINQTRSINFPDQHQVQISFPEYRLGRPAYGPFHADVRMSPRIAPRMQGLGIIEAIPETQIAEFEDPQDLDGDGISGRANRVYDMQTKTQRIGRFGWKAAKASLEQQNLAALLNDIGISSWLFPQAEGDCSPAQTECISLSANTLTTVSNSGTNTSASNKIEASREMTDLLTAFTRIMGETALVSSLLAQSLEKPGKRLFEEIGCLACHTDRFKHPLQTTTGSGSVSPYSDLLLHDMGDALADNRREFQASGREWRTAPLWGLGHYLQQTATPMLLHDGRADTVLDAILWHGGEAEPSKQHFMGLPKTQREQLIQFVEAL